MNYEKISIFFGISFLLSLIVFIGTGIGALMGLSITDLLQASGITLLISAVVAGASMYGDDNNSGLGA